MTGVSEPFDLQKYQREQEPSDDEREDKDSGDSNPKKKIMRAISKNKPGNLWAESLQQSEKFKETSSHSGTLPTERPVHEGGSELLGVSPLKSNLRLK